MPPWVGEVQSRLAKSCRVLADLLKERGLFDDLSSMGSWTRLKSLLKKSRLKKERERE